MIDSSERKQNKWKLCCWLVGRWWIFRKTFKQLDIWNKKEDLRAAVLVPYLLSDQRGVTFDTSKCLFSGFWLFYCGQIQISLGIFSPKGDFEQLVLVAAEQHQLWIQICNLKDGGYGDKDRDVWERRGPIIIIRASSFAHKHRLTPPPLQKTSLWSWVTPIMPAKPSLSVQAADLRSPCQQIGLGEGLQPEKGGSLPPLLYLKSITLAFTFSISPPNLLPSPPCQQWQWSWASSPTEPPCWIVISPFTTSPTDRPHAVSGKA